MTRAPTRTVAFSTSDSTTRKIYFSRRTPLKAPPFFFAWMNSPVLVLRFVHKPVFVLRLCDRFATAPARKLLPVFFATP